jgi:hypothetical protein
MQLAVNQRIMQIKVGIFPTLIYINGYSSATYISRFLPRSVEMGIVYIHNKKIGRP